MSSRRAPRVGWRRVLKSSAFPRELRAVLATLLMLSDVMAPDGTLIIRRQKMIDATGLPARTVIRHLARAVDGGWLIHEVHGGNGRAGTYLAAFPTKSCEPHLACNSGSCEPSSTHNSAEVASHLVALSIRDSANASEHGALDSYRERRDDPHGARVAVNSGPGEKRGDEQTAADHHPSPPAVPAAQGEPLDATQHQRDGSGVLHASHLLVIGRT